RYAASTSGNPSFSVLRQLQYLCELTQRPWQLCDLRQFLTTYSIISNVSFPSLNLWLGLMKNSQITLKKENIIKNKII
ncbi:hypothetical protein ACQE62_21290, partial [Klebsiella pneumoniae]|nr:hypothetical protein [Klebsiella pneumoniae]MDS7059741.1 hypothetical protein [Klebsiella pneumoniae]